MLTPTTQAEQGVIPLPDSPGIEAGWEILTVGEDRAAGKFTAAGLARNEQRRESVVRMLAEGLSIAAVARAHGMSRNTVMAAARRFGPQIEQRKQSVGALALDVARLSIERIRDEIDDMPKASLPIIAGVMIDKAQLLSGAPTARVEHVERSAPASFNDWLDSLVNVSAQPVAQAETAGQKGAASEVALPADVVPAALHASPRGDTLSPALSHSSEESADSAPIAGQIAPASASPSTLPPTGGGDHATGGGGVHSNGSSRE